MYPEFQVGNAEEEKEEETVKNKIIKKKYVLLWPYWIAVPSIQAARL